jgi:ABC-type nitrate/sulfonate/bicarbonate transport system permease component
MGGRDPSERVVAISWNEWSRSIGIAGRDQPVRARWTLVAALKVNAGLSLVGAVVGEFQSTLAWLSQSVRQPDFKMNIVMTGITILAVVSSLMYLAISWLETAVMRRR